MTDFTVIKISGKDAITLLNSLSTNLIKHSPGTTYSCLLTPNGRFMYDFLLLQGEETWIAINQNFADGFIKYISMYKMSSNCTLESTNLGLSWNANSATFQDPRHSQLGFYTITDTHPIDTNPYHIHRMKLKIVDGFHDLTQKESIILDYGLDELNAISYTKGCYLGQELIARTHHTGVIRKKVYYFECNNILEKGTEITQGQEKIGKVLGGVCGHYLAVIKFENLDINKPCNANGTDFFVQ